MLIALPRPPAVNVVAVGKPLHVQCLHVCMGAHPHINTLYRCQTMDVGLPTAASDSAAALPIQSRPHPPFEQESGHGREHEAYSNGKVTMGDERQSSAQVAKRAADAASASSSDAGDAELQRRKAALLQQVALSSHTLPQLQAL